MISPAIRVIVVLGILAMMMVSRPLEPWLVLLCAIAALGQVWGYFRYGTVWLAYRAAKRGDEARARRWLRTVRWPELLARDQRAYFHMLGANLSAGEGDAGAARKELDALREDHLRTDNDRCLAAVIAAEVHSLEGDRAGARRALDRARSLPHRADLNSEIDKAAARVPA